MSNFLNPFLNHSFSPLAELSGNYTDRLFAGLENAGKLLGRTVTLAAISAVVVAVTVVAFPTLATYFSTYATVATTLFVSKVITLSLLLLSVKTIGEYLFDINAATQTTQVATAE